MQRRAPAHRTPPVRLPFVLFLFLLAPSLPAQSAPPVRCDALLGWNGVVREGRYAPMIVSVENRGARLPVVVRVEVARGGGLRGSGGIQRSFTRETLLPAGATRRVPFVLPIARGVRSLHVGVFSQGAEIAGEDIDLRSAATTDRLVAGVSSELSLDMVSGLSDAGGAVRLVYPRVDDLPESWAGYDAVEMVVVHDTSFQQLRAAQVAALERWVVTGGSLVFTGGADALQHSGAGLGRLLPVEITGLKERNDLPSLASFLGLSRGPHGRIILAESRVTSGSILSSQEGVPVIVERRLGRGAIWFIAFDPTLAPMDAWEGSLPLWRRMAENDRQPVLDAAPHDAVDDPWMKTLIGNPPLSFPRATAALVFVGCYLGLLFPLLTGGIAGRIGARLRIVLLLAVATTACGAGWLVFNRLLFRSNALLLEVAKVDVVSGDGVARVTEKVGLFAAQGGASELSLGATDVAVDEGGRGSALPRAHGDEGLIVDTGRETILRGLSYGRFGSRLVVLTAVVPMPLEARVTADDGTFEVWIANGSARALRGCFLLREGRAYLIGDVGLNGTVTRRFAAVDGLSLSDPAARMRIAGDAHRASLWDQVGAELGTGPGVVAGWLDGPVLPLVASSAERAADRAALSLVVVEVR